MTSFYRVFDINNEAFFLKKKPYSVPYNQWKNIEEKKTCLKKHLGAQNVNPLLLCVLSNVKVMVKKGRNVTAYLFISFK